MGVKKLLTIFRDNQLPVDQEILELRNLNILDTESEEKIDDLDEKDYIFTNYNDFDYISDVHLIRKNGIKMISSENVLDMKTFIESGGRAIIPPPWFEADGISNSIISRFFGEDGSIHLEDLDPQTEITRYELFEHLRIGEISDELVIRAFAKKFNPVAIRDWVEHICYFSFYLHQAGFGSVPIELSSMQTEEELTISVTLNATDLSLANFTNSFGHVNPDYPLYSLLEVARVSAHLFSIALYKDTDKISFTGYWNKNFEQDFQREQCFILHEIDASDLLEGENVHPIVQTLDLLEDELEELEKESSENELPGNIIELLAGGAYTEENVQNVAIVVQAKIQEKIDAGESLELIEDEIMSMKEELLGREDAHLFEPFPEAAEVAKHMKRSEFNKNDEIERIRTEHSEDEDILVKGQKIVDDSLSQEISDNLEEESKNTFVKGVLEELDEAQKILGNDEEDNELLVAKSYQENLEEEIALVTDDDEKFNKSLKKNFMSQFENESDVLRLKSSEFFKSEDFQTKITGSLAQSVSEIWKVKKLSPEKIKETEASLMKSLQSTFSIGRDEAKTLIKGTFEKLKKEEVHYVKSQLLKEAGNEEVKESYIKKTALKNLGQEKEKNEELKSQNQLLRAQMKSLESQNVDKVDFQKKVKKQILEIEKRAKIASNKNEGEGVEETQEVIEELLAVKQKMQVIQKEFQIKNEQLITKLHEQKSKETAQGILISKTRQEHIKKLSDKEQEIHSLKEQNRAALKNVNYSTDDDSKIRIEKLEIDKKELAQIIDAQKDEMKTLGTKVINERDKRLDEREVKSRINRLEKENSAAQSVINHLKKEMGQKHQVVNRQHASITDFRQVKASDNSEMIQLKSANKKLDFKLRDLEKKGNTDLSPELDKLKSSSRQLERKYQMLEQKNHQLSRKLEKQKKIPTAPKKDPIQETKLKRLEQTQKKLSRDLSSANNLLAESKKDLVKFKNKENGLNLKIARLEKDLEKAKKREPEAA